MGANGLDLHVGRVVVAGIVGALALTFGASVAALAVGAALMAAATAAPPRETRAKESYACGSCGRSFESRRELRAHRDAVHARAFAIHTS
jgi:hypothetical protein